MRPECFGPELPAGRRAWSQGRANGRRSFEPAKRTTMGTRWRCSRRAGTCGPGLRIAEAPAMQRPLLRSKAFLENAGPRLSRTQVLESRRSRFPILLLEPSGSTARLSCAPHGPPTPMPQARSHRADASWEIRKHFFDSLGRQRRLFLHPLKNHRARDRASHELRFLRRGGQCSSASAEKLRDGEPFPSCLRPNGASLAIADFEGKRRHGNTVIRAAAASISRSGSASRRTLRVE